MFLYRKRRCRLFSFRVISLVAGNSKSITLRDLLPDTQYQVTITAIVGGKKFRSRPIVFKTSKAPSEDQVTRDVVTTQATITKKEAAPITPEIVNPDPTAVGSKYTPQTSTTVSINLRGTLSLSASNRNRNFCVP